MVTQKPVYYIPYLIDIPEKSIDIKRKIKSEDKFTVLLMGQDTIRKGLDDGITAFSRAFAEIENVQLIIKYHNLNQDQFRTFEDKIIALSQSNSSCKKNSTYILNKEMSNEEVYELYRNSSVLLMPSRGEGFCLPIAEAMSVGLPCIYTDWSAMPEVGESSYNKALAYHLDESIGMYQYGYEIGSMYAYPSILSTMQALYSMYELWNKDKENYYKRSKNNVDIIKDKFNINIIKLCFINLLNNSDKIAPTTILNTNYLKRNQIQYDEIIKRYKEK
jgi:glycosyltransferase involved in cell wall biosynthesis